MIAELRGGYKLCILGVTDPRDTAGILAALEATPQLEPCLKAFTGGGWVTLKPVLADGPITIPAPVRHVRLEGLIKEQIQEIKTQTQGLSIHLPGDLAHLQAAYTKVTTDPKAEYQWLGKFGFIKTYQQELDQVLGRMLVRLRYTRIEGIQGQADTDPRLLPHQVGLAPRTAAALLEQLQQAHLPLKQRTHPELHAHATLAGVELCLIRFPIVDTTGARWTEVVVLNDRPERLIYVNALAWEKLQDGDTDGDLAYLGASRRRLVYRTPKLPPAYPEFRITQGGSLLDRLVASLSK